jgi:hypothetical protein
MGAFADLVGDLGGAFSRGAQQGYVEDVGAERKKARDLAAAVEQFKALSPLHQEAATAQARAMAPIQLESDTARARAMLPYDLEKIRAAQEAKRSPVERAITSAMASPQQSPLAMPSEESAAASVPVGVPQAGEVAYPALHKVLDPIMRELPEGGSIKAGPVTLKKKEPTVPNPPVVKGPITIPDSMVLDVASGALGTQTFPDGTILDKSTALAMQEARGLRPKTEPKPPSQANSPEGVMGELFPGKSWGDLSAGERGIVNKEANKRAMVITESSGASRGKAFGNIRMNNVIDTKNGNVLVMMNSNDLNDANAAEPGRFIPAGEGGKQLGKTALVEDIRGAISNTRKSLAALPTEFTPTQAAQISIALRSKGGSGSVDAVLGSSIGKSLTPEQIDYITDLAQLVENAMAMRSVLGAGQGSDELRDAIRATLPTARTPSKAFAASQLDKFEGQINRLSRGIPGVPLKPEAPIGGVAQPAGDPLEGKTATGANGAKIIRKGGKWVPYGQ